MCRFCSPRPATLRDRGSAGSRPDHPRKDAVNEIRAVEADLLRSEGIDPAWRGFPETTEEPDSSE